jgi:hypothetical protein
MGDAAHRLRKSDHNQGNAIDITHSPDRGMDIGTLFDAFRHQMLHNPAGRISYLIYDRQIASTKNGWRWRAYLGPNAHRTHGHLSIKPSARLVLRPWTLA